MTIAIQRTTDGADTIFFDAVISYGKTYASTLTKHPIDGSGSINDHIITENPTFQIKGVFSDCDFNLNRPSGSDISFLNNSPIQQAVKVEVQSSILSVIASSLLPMAGSAQPKVTLDERGQDLTALVKDLLVSIRDSREAVTLIEFKGGIPTAFEFDLVITSLQFSEDADMGSALTVDISFERARFVELLSAKVAKTKTTPEVKDKAAGSDDKGVIPSPENKTIFQDLKSGDVLTDFNNALGSMKNMDGKSFNSTMKFLNGLSQYDQ